MTTTRADDPSGITYSVTWAREGSRVCDWCDGDAVVILRKRPGSGGDWMCWYHFDKYHPTLTVPA